MNNKIYILSIVNPQSYGFSTKEVHPFADKDTAISKMRDLFCDACREYNKKDDTISMALENEGDEFEGICISGSYAYVSDMWYIDLFEEDNPFYKEEEESHEDTPVSRKLIDYVANDLNREQMYELMSNLYEFRGGEECESIFDLQNKEDAKLIFPSLIEKDVDVAEAFEARYVIDGLNYKKPLFLDTEAKMGISLNGLLADMEERFLTEFKDNDYSCEWIANVDHFPYMDFIGFCNANLPTSMTEKKEEEPIDIFEGIENPVTETPKVKYTEEISYEEALLFMGMYAFPIIARVFEFDGWDGETRFVRDLAERFLEYVKDIDWGEGYTTIYDEAEKFADRVILDMANRESPLSDYILCAK